MTEVVGSAAIELRLDQSRFNRELRDLETLQLKPIALGLQLNLPQLQQQLKGVRLESIAVGLNADTSSLQKQLQAFSATLTVKAVLDTTTVDRQLKAYAGERTLKLTARVDDRELTALNKHLDLKQKHFAQVNEAFKATPLTPRVDLRQLEALDGRLKSIQKRYDIDVNFRVDAGALRSQISAIDVPVILRYANTQPLGALTQKVEIDSKGIETSLGNSVEQAFKKVRGGGLFSGFGSLITAPLRLAGSGISTILGGLTLGATQEVSRNLGKGLSTAFEGALSKSVGSSELLGAKVGGAIGSAVVQEFQTQTQTIAQVLEKQIDKIQDTKLRKKLKENLKSVVELPGQVGQAVIGTIGQDTVTREGLFQRGQQRQAQAAKTPVAREEAVAAFRELIATSKSVEARATQSKATLDRQIQTRQREVTEVGKRYEQLAIAIQQAEVGGAKTEDLAPLASELSATAQDFQALSQSLGTLVQARDVASKAVQEAKQGRVAARQQLDQVSPEQQPRAFTELAQSTLGESFDAEKLPKLVVDEARLKASGAGSLYVPAENAIITTNKIYDAVLKQALTQQQADTLGEEIAHAEDFDFGSFKGIQAARENRPIGQRVTPTNEEAARFAPELGRYAQEKREAELNAKVKGARGAQDYLQRQDRLQVVSEASDVAVQGEKFTAPARKAVFKEALITLKQEAAKRFTESDQSIDQFIGSYKASLTEIESIAQRAAQSAGSATREEVAGLQQEMNAAIASLSSVFDAVGTEIRRVQAIAPEEALQEKQQQIAGLLKQFNKKELVPLAEQVGVQDAGKLKKKDLIQQITSTADIRQLEPKVFDLTRAKAQQQLEQRAAGAQTVGSVARGAADLAGATAGKVQDIAASAPVQGVVQAAGTAGKVMLAVGKAGYKIASGMESLALDLVPAGRAIKGIAQQTVVPAALFAGATAFIPGGAGVAAGLSHVVGGVASPLLHAAGAGATDAASSAIAGHIPNAFGLANGITTALTGAIDGAVNAASAGIAQAGAAILGGKAIQTVAGRTIGGAVQATGLAALPPSTAKALPPAQTDVEAIPVTVEAVPQRAKAKQLPPVKPAQPAPREGREGLFQDLNEQYSVEGLREVAKRLGLTSKRSRSLKKEDLARELSSTDFGVPIDKVLAEVGDSAKLKAFQTGSQGTVPKLPAEALTSIKSGSEKLKQLYKQFQTAQGQQRLVLARAIATESDQQVAAIDQAFKEFQVEGKTAQQLAGLRTQLTQRSELPRSEARNAGRQQIQETQRQGSSSRAVQTVNATVVDVSSGDDLNSANLLNTLREGSQVVSRELGNAIERFNEAQQTLADTINTQVARFAEIEPEATLPATLQKAAGTPKGKDLLVNTAGFAASIAGNQLGGAAGGLAGDLIGALAARNALSGGQFGQGDDLFGDLAGFAIGNGAAALGSMVPGVAGIPFKGAAVAMAAVPQLTKLRQRIQGRLGEDDEAKASGDDLAAANLTSGATSLKRTLTSKSRQLLSQLEKQLGDTIDSLALAFSSDKDYASNAGQQEIRALNQLNQTVERLLEERGQIISETFDAEMTRANQELLQIGARIAAKTEARPDFGLLADRAIDDGTQAKSQQVVGENQQELRANKRRAFELERKTGVVADASLTRIEDPIAGSDLKGVFGTLRTVFKGVQTDIRAAVTRQAEALTVESKSLLNDIRSSEAVAKGSGDQTQAKRLGKAGDRAEKAIAGSEAILAKPTSALTDKEIAKLREYRKELLSVYKLLDRPLPTPAASGGASGFGQLLDVFGKLKPLIGPVLAGLIGFQGLQFATTQLKDFVFQAIQASIKLDNLKTALNFASGSSTVGAQNLAFVRGEVERLRVPLSAAQEGFVKLAASTRGTNSQSATKPLFTGIASASTVLGLTSEESNGTSLAFSQIASKGKVYTEELLQLQERIPSFMATVQRALGLSGAELSKALQAGAISADEFLPKIARQLQVEFGGAAVDASKNAQSAIFNVQNKFLELQQSVGAAFGPALIVGANLLGKILEGIAQKAAEGAEGINKISATLGVILTPINAIASRLATIPGIGKAFEVAMNAVLAVLATIAASVAVSLLGKLLALPAIAKVIAAGFSAIGGSLAAAFAALPALLAKFFLLQLAVEAVTGALSVFVPSDLGNQFKGFADQAEANLKRIEDAAKRAKGEVQGVAPPEELPSEGPDIGKVLTFGAASFKTDDLLKGINGAQEKVNLAFGADKDYGKVTTLAEKKGQNDVLEATRFGDSARALSGQVFEGDLGIKAKLLGVADLDKQTQAVQNQRALAANKPQADKNEIAGLDKQLAELNAKREAASAPLIEQRGAITAQLNNAKAGLQAIDAKNLPVEQAKLLKAPFEEAVSQLEKAQAAINKFEGGIKTSVSAGRELTTTFTKLATELEEARRIADRVFNQSSQNILKQQFANFTKDPRAAQVAAVNQSKTEQTRLQAQFDAGQTTLDQQETALKGADAQTLLGTIPIGNSGKTVTIGSSLAEIEEALKGTPDNQTDKKAILERLKEFREGTDKQQQLGTQVEQARVTVQKTEESSALADIDRDAGKRDQSLKRDDAKRAIPIRQDNAALAKERAELSQERARLSQKRAGLTLDKANNKFFSEADAGIVEADAGIAQADLGVKTAQTGVDEADLGVKTAQNQVASTNQRQANTQQALDDLTSQKGRISAEEYNKRQRELTTQLTELRLEGANAAVAVEEALAKKVEATSAKSEASAAKSEASAKKVEALNRKILEGLELANRQAGAAIQLSATNDTTAVKQQLASQSIAEEDTQPKLNAIATAQALSEGEQIKKEIAQNAQLERDKRQTKKETILKALELNQKLAESNQKVVDLELERQKLVRDLAIKGIEDRMAATQEASNEQLAALDREKTAIVEIGQKALELQTTLLQSKGDLQKSLDALATSKLEIKVKVAEEGEKLLGTVKDPQANSRVKKVARRQLSELGFSSSAKEGDLADGRLKLEQQLAVQKQAALLREQGLQQLLLEIEIKKQEFAAKSAQFEARKNVLLQEQAILQAKNNLDKAKELAPGRERDRAIAAASSDLSIAQKGLGNAQELSGLADQQFASVGKNADLQRRALGAKQQNELTNFQADQRSRLRGSELERAGLKGNQSSFNFKNAAKAFYDGTAVQGLGTGSQGSTVKGQQIDANGNPIANSASPGGGSDVLKVLNELAGFLAEVFGRFDTYLKATATGIIKMSGLRVDPKKPINPLLKGLAKNAGLGLLNGDDEVDPAEVTSKGEVQRNKGVQSGNYAAMNRALKLGGGSNDDRGLRDTSSVFSLQQSAPTPDSSSGVVESSSSGKTESFNSELIGFLGTKLDLLNANIERLANTPRAIAFHSQQPVDDYADYQNRNTGNLLRA
jgi:tape measure domain-containing protein